MCNSDGKISSVWIFSIIRFMCTILSITTVGVNESQIVKQDITRADKFSLQISSENIIYLGNHAQFDFWMIIVFVITNPFAIHLLLLYICDKNNYVLRVSKCFKNGQNNIV